MYPGEIALFEQTFKNIDDILHKDAGCSSIDHHKALTGDDLKDFVDHKLFPYLKKFKTSAESADTIEYKIGEIFSELKNKIHSGCGD